MIYKNTTYDSLTFCSFSQEEVGKLLYFTSSLVSHAFHYHFRYTFVIIRTSGNDDELGTVAKNQKMDSMENGVLIQKDNNIKSIGYGQ